MLLLWWRGRCSRACMLSAETAVGGIKSFEPCGGGEQGVCGQGV